MAMLDDWKLVFRLSSSPVDSSTIFIKLLIKYLHLTQEEEKCEIFQSMCIGSKWRFYFSNDKQM
jgi:hypothetical protein